jgi:hypothetical protein
MGDLNFLAKTIGGSIDENTKIIRLMLEGLSAIHKLWPLWLAPPPTFYSDRDNYIGQEHKFLFHMPTEEEISKL